MKRNNDALLNIAFKHFVIHKFHALRSYRSLFLHFTGACESLNLSCLLSPYIGFVYSVKKSELNNFSNIDHNLDSTLHRTISGEGTLTHID